MCAMPEPDAQVERSAGQESSDLTETALKACVQAAVAAPSIHNSQPWLFRIRADGIDVYADWRRRLEVIDPSGRELMISVGAAVFNVRVAMYRRARVPVLRLWPERSEPDLVARVVAGAPATPAGR
jgi:nitroreductase